MSTGGYIVTLGETMAMFYGERIGTFAHLPVAAVGVGGAESNVAIAARRLGADVHWIGRVGDDSLGTRVTRELRAEGLMVHAVIDGNAPTGLMMKERPRAGTSRVRYYRAGSAGSRLQPADIPADLIEKAGVLHVTGITPALSASASAATFSAVERARAAHVPVSFDINYRSRLWGVADAAPIYAELITKADIVFAGDEEASILVGAGSPAHQADRLRSRGPETVIIKLGADGSHSLAADEHLDVPAVQIRVEDSVGAGDAFVGAYLAEFVAGAPSSVRLKTAAIAGAYACTVPGDWEGLPTRHDIEGATRRDDVDR